MQEQSAAFEQSDEVLTGTTLQREAVGLLVDSVRGEQEEQPTPGAYNATVGAMALIAETRGLQSFAVSLNAGDFAKLRSELTLEDQEEQARRWGGAEMRFLTRCGVTRVFVTDHV